MAITTFAQSPKRTKIAYVGPLPPGVTEEFTARGFDLFPLDPSSLTSPGLLQQVDSALFFQQDSKPTSIRRDLEDYAGILLAYDCRLYVHHLPVVPGDGGDYLRRHVVNAIQTLKLPVHALETSDRPMYGPFVYVVPSPCNWREIANIVKNNPAGAAPNGTTRIIGDKEQSDERRLLIQRAFHDCEKVDLIPLGNGMSGVDTYRVYAELQGGVVPSHWPYVYFVKLGNREAIAKEYYNYRESAMGHVPFHLGPRLKLDRCALGYEFGILVSDYVTGAETLKDCARDGRAATAVGNLFSTTIASWRSGAEVVDLSLVATLEKHFPKAIPDHRRPLMTRYGAALDIDRLLTQFQGIDSRPVLMGVIHGDLHATNVLVRGSDSIIIDFEKIEMNEPVLFDAASLEAGLFIDGFIGDRRSGEEVMRSIEQLYSVAALNGEMLTCHPKDGSSWFFDCVRQIRLHAQPMEQERNQYAATLACVLAKKACKDIVFIDNDGASGRLAREDVRAMAMVLAERIIEALSEGV